MSWIARLGLRRVGGERERTMNCACELGGSYARQRLNLRSGGKPEPREQRSRKIEAALYDIRVLWRESTSTDGTLAGA